MGDLHVPWLRADTPIGRLKGLQLTDNRAIEKGVEKTELITKGAQLVASLTQVKLHLLNFRADDPNNWEVAEFLPERVSNRGLLTFGSRFKTIARRKESQTIIFALQKRKQGRCIRRNGTCNRFNSHRAKQLLGHKQFLFAESNEDMEHNRFRQYETD